ncbi:hypothetical protein [Mesorhizobium sp. Root157]|uniref:hypothetical protein n=1 Tax=Mesorhizobium sp. Root157 TaxID=1736477 RepID=UPI0039B7816E
MTFPIPSALAPPEEIRGLLLKSGLWPSFQTRPFGRIPDADAIPDAIFVTAMAIRWLPIPASRSGSTRRSSGAGSMRSQPYTGRKNRGCFRDKSDERSVSDPR